MGLWLLRAKHAVGRGTRGLWGDGRGAEGPLGVLNHYYTVGIIIRRVFEYRHKLRCLYLATLPGYSVERAPRKPDRRPP